MQWWHEFAQYVSYFAFALGLIAAILGATHPDDLAKATAEFAVAAALFGAACFLRLTM